MPTMMELGQERSRVRKGAVRPEITPAEIRGLLADVATAGGVPFVDAAQQAQQGNYGQAAISGLLDAPPVKMAGIALAPLIGMVRKAAPMDEALRIAQKNAAKPVSEGGLGLPPDNTPMDRARALGFDIDAYHNTDAPNIEAFSTRKSRRGAGVSASIDQSNAQSYGNISYPLKINTKNFFDPNNTEQMAELSSYIEKTISKQKPYEKNSLSFYPFTSTQVLSKLPDEITGAYYLEQKAISDSLKKMGYYGSIGKEAGQTQMKVYDPSRIRSRFAAFDPARINENNLLASLAALGISIPVMRGLLQEEEMQ